MESESKPTMWNVDAVDFVPSGTIDFAAKAPEKAEDKKKPFNKNQKHKKKNFKKEEKKTQHAKDCVSISIVGADGSGKTTISNVLSGNPPCTQLANCRILCKDSKFRRYVFFDTAGSLYEQVLPISITDYSILSVSVVGIREQYLKEVAVLLKNYVLGRLIIAITHVEQINWDHDAYNAAVIEIRKVLDKYGVIDTLCVPVGASVNISQRVTKDIAPWYNGKTLSQVLDTLETPHKKLEKGVKMPILPLSADQAQGYLGKVLSGTLTINSKISLLPSKDRVEILKITDINGGDIEKATTSDIIKLTFKNHINGPSSGLLVCEMQELSVVSRVFRAEVNVFNLDQNVINPGFSCQIYFHSAVEDCTITDIISVTDWETKAKNKMETIRSDQRAMVVIHINNSICAENASKGWDILSKFSLVLNNRVVGVGKVVELHNRVEEVASEMGF
ncbi:hypothetical protein SteCoe_21509 [Stentor coeruleus]|uniref:GTP-eEF1A C-terminal domain-containing protein n=1 Tax=Stentor coeruleus TaxID=5963 RepID=A0A1R2BPA7_9CILI|nr:hypothetical protein SteCoe_21509 [Stentor coeruleus]